MTEEQRKELETEVGAGRSEAREGSGAEGRPDPGDGAGDVGEGVGGDEGNALDRPLGLMGWSKGKVRRPAGRPLASGREAVSAEQRLLILDTWKRSGLAAGDFAELVGVARHTLHAWRQKFREYGPEGLMDRPRGRGKTGSRLPEVTRRAILMLKQEHPEYGCQRISDLLARGPALPASEGAVARVLKEAGYTTEPEPTRPHPDVVRSFERARPNQLWQTDLFSFVLKRQNRRVYLVGFIDDHSRFMVGYGVWASSPTALVIEVFRAAVGSYRAPMEVLTDNGPQYVTWRGKSAFSKELERQGVKHLVAKPKRPQTLGKIERFWGTLWRECLEGAVFVDLEDARRRVGHFIDHYNFHRPHQGIDGLVPADRNFRAAPEVLAVMRARVAENALALAQHGLPKRPFYMAGQVGGKAFSVHAEGERVILTGEGARREEVSLVAPEGESAMPEPVAPSGTPAEGEETAEPELGPGESELDRLGALEVAEAQAAFPVERRAALAGALMDYRREVLSRDGCVVSMTRWLRPGVAWAMDFLDPPAPVDGLHEKILAVRDLGSGAHLMWLPMPAESGEGVKAALQALLLEHGAPLLVKSDNGSVFLEAGVRELLRERGIVHLLSPPYYPRYNGACESGNGTLAAYTHHESAIRGCPGEWSSDDLEGARRRANEVVRSRGLGSSTAWERWRARRRVGEVERAAFGARVARRREEALAEVEDELGAFVSLRDLASARRLAIERACVEVGLLEMRRRRICTPVSYKKLVRIW